MRLNICADLCGLHSNPNYNLQWAGLGMKPSLSVQGPFAWQRSCMNVIEGIFHIARIRTLAFVPISTIGLRPVKSRNLERKLPEASSKSTSKTTTAAFSRIMSSCSLSCLGVTSRLLLLLYCCLMAHLSSTAGIIWP